MRICSICVCARASTVYRSCSRSPVPGTRELGAYFPITTVAKGAPSNTVFWCVCVPVCFLVCVCVHTGLCVHTYVHTGNIAAVQLGAPLASLLQVELLVLQPDRMLYQQAVWKRNKTYRLRSGGLREIKNPDRQTMRNRKKPHRLSREEEEEEEEQQQQQPPP